MPARIKNIIEPPSWFDLTNYRGLDKLNIKEWLHLLTLRHILFEIGTQINLGDEFYYDIYKEPLKIETGLPFYLPVRKTPREVEELKISDFLNDLSIVFYEPRKSHCDELLQFRNTIKKLTKEDGFTGYVTRDGKLSPNQTYEADKSLNEFLNQHSQLFDGSFTLKVNLLQNDNAILKSFKLWLKEARKSKVRKSTMIDYSKEITKWNEKKVIQYLDLKYWSNTTKTKLTNDDYARFLFPDKYIDDDSDYPKYAEKIAKQIEPLANKLIDKHTLEIIYRDINQI